MSEETKVKPIGSWNKGNVVTPQDSLLIHVIRDQ